MFVIQLPDYTLAALLLLWLKLSDVSKLDISLTNKYNRSPFLSVISLRGVTFDCNFRLTRSLGSWLNARLVHIRSIYIDGYQLIDGRIGLEIEVCYKVTHIICDGSTSTETTLDTINLCPMLTSLCGCTSYEYLLPHLSSIQLKQLTELGDMYIAECGCISDYCHNLTSLTNIRFEKGIDDLNDFSFKKLLTNNTDLRKLTVISIYDQPSLKLFLAAVAETHPNIKSIVYGYNSSFGINIMNEYFDVTSIRFKTRERKQDDDSAFVFRYRNINGIKAITCRTQVDLNYELVSDLMKIRFQTLDLSQYAYLITPAALGVILSGVPTLTTVYLNSEYSTMPFTLKDAYKRMSRGTSFEVKSRNVRVYMDDILLVD